MLGSEERLHVTIVNNGNGFGGAVGQVFGDVFRKKCQYHLMPLREKDTGCWIRTKRGIIDSMLEEVRSAKRQVPDADYFATHKMGLVRDGNGIWFFGAVYVKNHDSVFGKAQTATFEIPKMIGEHLLNGKNLEESIEIAFGKGYVTEEEGLIAYLTRRKITNEMLWRQALFIALTDLLNRVEFPEHKW